ncbi:hypothetical protein A5707_19405 [Mycobacterium kyorinense]|uniref:DUF2339 domain-containing protein n=1 Tax=Mycobacterium kyorinense TaxID=487514 RepID=A0A1A2ZB47_9MYCO|nr:DUF2339 domain-containing protein [Mycobacterium kyorinense]OBI47450.1 hypothetical protein A5707_19405 [Mycobacterium kyorinense]
MTQPHAVITRLSADFESISRQMSRVSGDLAELDRYFASWAAAAAPVATLVPEQPRPAPLAAPPPAPRPAPRSEPPPPPAWTPPREWRLPDAGVIGKILAVAGVAVTLVGVVLLLVLAAKAGLLRPEIRVAGGTVLAAALVGVGARLHGKPGGRIGAIALAATGVAAGYLDVIAVTTIYRWAPAAAGLAIAAAVGTAGLALARRWNSEHLGLLVLIPLIGLAPVLTRGVDLMLIGFMLALSAAALAGQWGRDWIWMFAARIAAPTAPLLIALAARGGTENPWLLGGLCRLAALLAIVSGLMLIPVITRTTALAVLTAAGTVPVLACGVAVDRLLATLLTGSLAAGLLALVILGSDLPRIVVQIWSALSAVSALIAVDTAFHGYLEAPVLLAIAITVAVAGRKDAIARWVATGFGAIGILAFLSAAHPTNLLHGTAVSTSVAVATMVTSVLVIAYVAVMSPLHALVVQRDLDLARVLAGVGAGYLVYSVTMFTVTAGVLVGGTSAGFLAGHMAATICWTAMAATLFIYARRSSGQRRTVAVTGGLALTAAAIAKLFLFDLGTLDGIFRVTAFIVVGLALLAMGTGYARSLAQRDTVTP